MVATSNWALGQLTSVLLSKTYALREHYTHLVTTITVFTKHITTFGSYHFLGPYICSGPLINEHPVLFQLNFNKASSFFSLKKVKIFD